MGSLAFSDYYERFYLCKIIEFNLESITRLAKNSFFLAKCDVQERFAPTVQLMKYLRPFQSEEEG